jgi:hypothetical protein
MDIPEGTATKPPTVLFTHDWRLLIFWRTEISVNFQQRPGLFGLWNSLIDKNRVAKYNKVEYLGGTRIPLGWEAWPNISTISKDSQKFS